MSRVRIPSPAPPSLHRYPTRRLALSNSGRAARRTVVRAASVAPVRNQEETRWRTAISRTSRFLPTTLAAHSASTRACLAGRPGRCRVTRTTTCSTHPPGRTRWAGRSASAASPHPSSSGRTCTSTRSMTLWRRFASSVARPWPRRPRCRVRAGTRSSATRRAAGWRQLLATGAVPVPRYGTCAAVGADGRLWISHGFTQDGNRFADTVAYDFASGGWADETPVGDAPGARCLHGCWWTDADRFVLYAGQTTGVTALGDRWELTRGERPGTNTWAQLSGTAPPERNLYAYARVAGATPVAGGAGRPGRQP